MKTPRLFALALASTLSLATLSGAALAHHGWSWAESEQMQLEGTIERISMAPPHPMLHVRDAEGVVWQVDLGNPRQTERSGFTGDTAKTGDDILVIGNRSRDSDEAHMKAVRIVLAGTNYDMYPERITDG